jgi:hypothetical protein
MIKNVFWLSCMLPIILVRFQWNLNFIHNFRQELEHQISWKSVQPSCSVRLDRRTEMTKLIVAFRNVVNAPKISKSLSKYVALLTLKM